jgi:hypothetical protein
MAGGAPSTEGTTMTVDDYTAGVDTAILALLLLWFLLDRHNIYLGDKR